MTWLIICEITNSALDIQVSPFFHLSVSLSPSCLTLSHTDTASSCVNVVRLSSSGGIICHLSFMSCHTQKYMHAHKCIHYPVLGKQHVFIFPLEIWCNCFKGCRSHKNFCMLLYLTQYLYSYCGFFVCNLCV